MYGGRNTLLLGESLSVGSVLFENDSHFAHLITSQYECGVNRLWTAQYLRVIVPLVLRSLSGINLTAWELNFRGFSHLKWKKIPGEGPRTPRPRQSTTPKEGGWYATADPHHHHHYVALEILEASCPPAPLSYMCQTHGRAVGVVKQSPQSLSSFVELTQESGELTFAFCNAP